MSREAYRHRQVHRSLPCVVLYGIASVTSGDISDFYRTRIEAESALRAILLDEPDFEGILWIEALEVETSVN
jgi:hypothetical protein